MVSRREGAPDGEEVCYGRVRRQIDKQQERDGGNLSARKGNGRPPGEGWSSKKMTIYSTGWAGIVPNITWWG